MTPGERAWAERRQRQLIRQADALSRELGNDLPEFLAGWTERRREQLLEEANWLRSFLGLPRLPDTEIDTAA